MERITTRDTRAVGVGVKVGNGVSVAVAVSVGVKVGVRVAVSVGVAVGAPKGNPPMFDSWQASNSDNERMDKNNLRFLFKNIVIDSLWK
jgi:hypothetical protein